MRQRKAPLTAARALHELHRPRVDPTRLTVVTAGLGVSVGILVLVLILVVALATTRCGRAGR